MIEIIFNTAILIASILLSIMVMIFYYRYYEPYFFPNLIDTKNINNIIKTNNTYSQKLLLIKGIMPINNSEITYKNSESDRYKNNYVRFMPSINREFGNQFTYSFWFNKKQDTYCDKVLFYKGNKDNKTPEIVFKNSEALQINFKTNDREDNVFEINNNLFKITNHDSWFMLTIIFKDYKEYNKYVGIEVLVYLNNTLLDIKKFKNKTLKRIDDSYNDNEFKILPSTSDDTHLKGQLADIKYFNYALDYQEINNLYKNGFNQDTVFFTYSQLNQNRNKKEIHHINLYNRIRN